MKGRCKTLAALMLCIVLLSACSSAMAAPKQNEDNRYVLWNALAARAVGEAKALIGSPVAQDAVALTNAGYAVVNGLTTEGSLEGLRQWNGAMAGKGNLLEVHSARSSALWFFLYNGRTGDGVYCELNASTIHWLTGWIDYFFPNQIRTFVKSFPKDELFSRLVKENVLAENLLASEDAKAAWNAKVKAKVFGGREFAIVTIANGVAHGTPYDLLKSIQFHDHYCPGVTSGYLLANYLEKFFPLYSADDKYFVLSIPPWCKDDALQILLNTTPGKSGYAVYYLNTDDKANIKDEAKDIAGIFFRYNGTSKLYEGIVLTFSFSTVTAMSGFDTSVGYGWDSRLAMDLWFLDYLNQPELFITEIRSFELPYGTAPTEWARPGTDPLKELGLWKE